LAINKLNRPRIAKNVEHTVVYRRENEFASHPYVRGFWETAAGHLICNFSCATVDYHGDPNQLAHINLVRTAVGGRRAVTVRSEDRGKSWQISNEDKNRSSNDVRAPQPGIDGKRESLFELAPIDYSNRNVLISNFNYQYMRDDFLVKDFVTSLSAITDAPERQVFIRISKDAGSTWSRSVMLPLDGLYSLAAVESSMVRSDGCALLFLSGVTKQGSYSRPIVYRSSDDGTNFHFMSFVTPNDTRYEGLNQMYPRGLMLPNGRLLCTLRLDRDWSGDMWTELHKSDDDGRTWQFLSRVNDFGAPSAPLRMSDGRLVMVYGSRLPPAGIRAVVSEDEGLTWSSEIIVRDDAGSWDVGYPRAWEASPGRIGAIYYYNSKDDPTQLKPVNTLWGAGGVRYIARSFFSVD
jgi:BNR repeat-like domain